MQARTWLQTGLAGLLALAAWQAQAGLEIVGEEDTTTLVSEGQLKSEARGPEDVTHIFDVNAGTITLVHPTEGIHATGTPADYCQALKELQEEMEADLTEEERRMVEEFKRGLREQTKENPEVRVEERGPGEQVAGYGTRHYRVLVDDQLTEEVWLSNDPSLLGEFGDYGKLIDMTTEVSRCVSDTMGIAGGSLEEQAAYQDLMRKGIELKSTEHSDGQTATERVQAVRERNIPAEVFRPPEDSREATIKEVMRAAQEAGSGP
ncbi:hypothetical protein AN478_05065 [Thiohalorhabdus denitrificans]|uniref:DUF4412 domain-containing protein n=1 Tax=Thiohalorhabdus denitrificans TaxID=381306 RepID=A0A0P9CCD5_9GAMM|nr:DUF4412 domain-containing protein [Thiohalorhabdus denitrificans]KPV40558.1 hypothetical protein AN478_05065 [Thiohalorhabdus denitrificans]SCY51419.1 Domain of unknown function [Thiohalorhabdus denitrificans]